ncbi:MAG TPA: DUF433 domain-containing protein [Gemmataceae bacterium]|jgi:uncharacterized protein (DUF433 family)
MTATFTHTSCSAVFLQGDPPAREEQGWIEKTPGVCGGEPRIRGTRHTVAGLVEWRKLGLSDARILEHHLDLTAADLQAAWAYYERNREEIDQIVRENEEA